jgi:hypothetical protein
MNDAQDQQLRLLVLRPDSAHPLASWFGSKRIHGVPQFGGDHHSTALIGRQTLPQEGWTSENLWASVIIARIIVGACVNRSFTGWDVGSVASSNQPLLDGRHVKIC